MKQSVSHGFWGEMFMRHIMPIMCMLLLFMVAFFFVVLPSVRMSLMNAQREKVKDLTQIAWIIIDDCYRLLNEGDLTEEQARDQALIHLKGLRYGANLKEYFWITDMNCHMVMHPYRSELEGVDLHDYSDPNGVFLFRKFVQLVREKGEGYVEYMWQWNDSPGRVMEKISYAKGFEPWGWIVGTGIYLDVIEREIDQIVSRMYKVFLVITFFLFIIGLFVIYRSYQAEKQKVEALKSVKKSETKFRAIYDDSTQFIGLLDSAGCLLDANKTSLQFIDKTLEDVKGMPFWQLPWWQHDGELRGKVEAGIVTCLKGETVRFLATNMGSDGSVIDIDFSLKPIFDDAGHVIQIIPEALDLSERIQFEQQLAKKNAALVDARKLLLAAIDHSPSGIILFNAVQGRIQMVNQSAYAFFGEGASSLCEMLIDDYIQSWDLYHLDGRTYRHEERLMKRVLTKGEIIEKERLFIKMKKQGKRCLLVNAAPIRDEQQNIVAGILLFLDITEENLLRERVAHADKMDSIGHLAGGIAHDFNNMLMGINGAAEMLQFEFESMLSESSREMLHVITSTTARATALTRQLLTFSSKHALVEKPVDMHKVINDTMKILNSSIDKRIEIKTDLRARSTVTVGDAIQLENMLLNLSINARDAMKEGGILSISTSNIKIEKDVVEFNTFLLHPGFFIRIDVKDSGVGIDPSIIKRVFDPFFTTKEIGQGTGLGLAAVYGTVKNHNGAITVSSELGNGALFQIYLPLNTNRSIEKPKSNENLISGQGLILLVDDEAAIRRTICRGLKNLGYEVLAAEDGKQGLDVFKENSDRIDLIIIDAIMPKMSGAEFYEMIRSMGYKTKIVFWSGYARREDVLDSMDDPDCRFIPKPCGLAVLSAFVADTLK